MSTHMVGHGACSKCIPHGVCLECTRHPGNQVPGLLESANNWLLVMVWSIAGSFSNRQCWWMKTSRVSKNVVLMCSWRTSSVLCMLSLWVAYYCWRLIFHGGTSKGSTSIIGGGGVYGGLVPQESRKLIMRSYTTLSTRKWKDKIFMFQNKYSESWLWTFSCYKMSTVRVDSVQV